MRRILPFFLALLLVACNVYASPPTKQLPGDLTLAEAQTVVNAALAFSVKQGIPMNIAVVDAGGNLKAFAREDGAFLGSIDIAQKKAITARYFNMSTAQLGAAAQPGKELFGIEVTNRGLVIFGGGELLVRNGVIVGAVGVSGGSVAEDTAVSKAGAAALK
ncbi:heme-binding protein [Desulfovibrio desulfuricans]|uniref:Heme-binding protein n=1 Tax=Desulfovibrio desulfuricans TaxID=876 RepID=A0A4P7UJ06_DESDE|nr:heme-binding protein [Desulfovibrio desulfuricans]QCC84481.1 heme-binding protein [Desulfovibrio desulfuricans]